MDILYTVVVSAVQMVKMMVTVVVIYALCWLPLHSVTLAGDTNPAVWKYRHIQAVWIASHWLAMSNCCYNPFVYFWMSSNFRSAFQGLCDAVVGRRRRQGGAAAAAGAGAVAGVHTSPPTTAVQLHAGCGGVLARPHGDRRAVRFVDSDDVELTMSSRDVTPRLARPRCTDVAAGLGTYM